MNNKAQSMNYLSFPILIYLIVFNLLLFFIAPSFQNTNKINFLQVDSVNFTSVDSYSDAEDLTLWGSIKYFFGNVIDFVSVFTFGDFINVEAVENNMTRYVLRLVLFSIFQLLPLTVLMFTIADWGRGK